MLLRSYELLRPGGLLFLVLPRACVDNSRYLTHELLLRILREGCCYRLVSHKFSPKLAFYVMKRPSGTVQEEDEAEATLTREAKLQADEDVAVTAEDGAEGEEHDQAQEEVVSSHASPVASNRAAPGQAVFRKPYPPLLSGAHRNNFCITLRC
jgi:hypothetical protein